MSDIYKTSRTLLQRVKDGSDEKVGKNLSQPTITISVLLFQR